MDKVKVNNQLIDLLTSKNDPALRRKVLRDLLDLAEDSLEVKHAKEAIIQQEWVAATLKGYNGNGTWGNSLYQKYRGTSWVLLHLSELETPQTEEIQLGAQHLLGTSKPVSKLKGRVGERFAGCLSGVFWDYPIVCLTAHMAAVLIRYGYLNHSVTQGAVDTCRHLLHVEEGFECEVMDHSLQPACMMAAPKVLKAFLAIPKKDRKAEDLKMINRLCSLLKKFQLYCYVAKDSRAWLEWAHKASSSQRRAAKPEWIKAGRLEPRHEKSGWTRFSFPLSYNSDLLEVLLLLGEAETEMDAVIQEGLEILIKKRNKQGMWEMVGGLNGKMWADLDTRGKPSPWITYRALRALKYFGMLDYPIR